MSDRTKPRARTVARVAGSVGGLTAGVATTLLVFAGSGSPAGAAPAPEPVPSRSVTTVPLVPLVSVHVHLPGLLNVHVDVPPVNGLLGGRSTAAPATRSVSGNGPGTAPTPRVPISRPTPEATRPTTRATSAPRPAPRPQRISSANNRDAGSGTTGFGADPGRDTTAVRSTPKATGTKHHKSVAERSDVFHRVFASSAPLWLLGVVVALCGLGTAFVVRLAGRGGRLGA